MRQLHLAIILLLTAAILIFALQNLGSVDIHFLWISAQMPLALLVVATYVVGMATGGSLWALIRRSIRGARLRR